jgi:preprotein translocase subunit SecE
MSGLVKFLKDSREELKKVVWPGRDEVVSSTLVVLYSVVIISIFLHMVDSLFEFLFAALVRFGSGS